ncbi:MAG: hypothetical protein K2J57_03515, partial [Bacteroidales bacterium]|nr:hypothetical protein [Bacteroidales bacterium]
MQKYTKYRRHFHRFLHSFNKRMWIPLCFLFALAPCGSAQLVHTQGNENIHFGLSIGGAANTTIPSSGVWNFASSPTKMGVSGGAYFQIDFAKRFFGHFELNISDRKLSASGHSADTAFGNYDIALTYTHIGVPLGVGVWLFPKTSDFNVSLTACALLNLPQEGKKEISVNNKNIDRNLSPVGVGAMLQIDILYRFVFLSFRYEITGTPVFRYANQSFRTGAFDL